MPTNKTHTHTPRVRLTDEQKRALRAHHCAYPEKTQQMLCAWVTAAFQLPRAPSPSTITYLFKSPPAPPDTELNRYTAARRTVRLECAQLENELVQWIYRCDQMGLLPVVTGTAIREKATKIRDELLKREALPSMTTAKLAAMTFSDSWLYHFQKRHGLPTTATEDTSAHQSAVPQKKQKHTGKQRKQTTLRNQPR